MFSRSFLALLFLGIMIGAQVEATSLKFKLQDEDSDVSETDSVESSECESSDCLQDVEVEVTCIDGECTAEELSGTSVDFNMKVALNAEEAT